MTTGSLAISEALGASNAPAPRVSLQSMEDKVSSRVFLNVGDAAERCGIPATAPMFLMTLCVLTMSNGFVVVGKSAPASAANYDREKGQTFAYEDAIRQLWPLEGYALRERLSSFPAREHG